MAQPMEQRKRISDLLPYLITAALMAAIFTGLFFLYIEDRSRETLDNLNIQLGITAERIESTFNAELGIAQRLAVIVAKKPSITASELDVFTLAMLPSDTAVTSVSAAPNAIVAWYYPRVSGQTLIGHDLLSNPERRRAVVDSIDKKSPVASGPSEALDGGFSVYVRAAVFTAAQRTEKLWGVISVAADFGKLMKKTGVKDDTGTVRFALSGPDAQNPSARTVFWGRRELLSGNPRRAQVKLPGLVWELAAVPSAGWRKARTADYLVLAAGIAACAAIMIAGFFSRGDESQRGIDEADAAALLDSVSSEIRTALAPVAGFLGNRDSGGSVNPIQLSGSDTAIHAHTQDTTEELARHSFRMLRRLSSDIRETIALERLEARTELIEMDIRSIISGLATEFGEQIALKKINLQTSVEAVIPQTIFGDPVRLEKIIYNLLGESIAYSEKGEVALSVILEDTVKNGVVLRFIVRDTGTVPPSDKFAGIFEAFSSSRGSPSKRFATTGLAMSLSGSLVRLLGGHLEYEPGSGQGLMVRFTLRFALSSVGEVSLSPDSMNLQNNPTVASDSVDELPVSANASAEKTVLPGKRTFFGFLSGRKKSNEENSVRSVAMNNGTLQKTIKSAAAGNSGSDGCSDEPASLKPTVPPTEIQEISPSGDSMRTAAHDGLKEEESFRFPHKPDTDAIPFAPRILLAEDGEVNREIIMRMLKSRTYTADIATDGRQALASCLRNEYDIVFMDCLMPVMDGYESTVRMRQLKGPGRPVVIGMTSSVKESERERCFASGMDDVISKPFTLDELVATIKKHSETD